MTRSRTAALVTCGALTALLAAGCNHQKPIYIQPSDPVIAVCQQPVVANIDNDDQNIDYANNYNDNGRAMSSEQMKQLAADSASLTRLADTVLITHPVFARAMLNEAREFATAGASANGFTTDTLATAVDGFTSQVDGMCSSFTVGTAPKAAKAAKPGPGLWDWQLFFEVTLGYVLMVFIASYLIAVSERSRQKHSRLTPTEIFWLAVIWPIGLSVKAGEIWAQFLLAASKTDEEKKDERMDALAAANRKLEQKLAKANEEIARAQEP